MRLLVLLVCFACIIADIVFLQKSVREDALAGRKPSGRTISLWSFLIGMLAGLLFYIMVG